MKLFSRNKPSFKAQETKREGFDGWLKCTHCKELVHLTQVEQNFNCCPKCEYHYRLSAKERIKIMCDENSFKELYATMKPSDPLSFFDSEPYKDRIKKAQKKSNRNEGAVIGTGLLEGRPCALGVIDFGFMGGSMGTVVGEKITLIIEYATENELPLIIVSASGGARMQESFLSLMQMAKTSAALAKHSESNLPYISVLTNPTTGGVTASFASLGDIVIAEPKALICFAGPRVIEQTLGEKLPEDAQKSEFLLKHGMIDRIVSRKNMKKELALFIDYLLPQKASHSSNAAKRDKLVSLKQKFNSKES